MYITGTSNSHHTKCPPPTSIDAITVVLLLYGPLPQNATLSWPNFRCTEKVNYIKILTCLSQQRPPLFIRPRFHCRMCGLIGGGILHCIITRRGTRKIYPNNFYVCIRITTNITRQKYSS
jgi:hypothetical protein